MADIGTQALGQGKAEAVAAISRLGTHKLIEANEKATELLIKGVTVEGLHGWDGGRALRRLTRPPGRARTALR